MTKTLSDAIAEFKEAREELEEKYQRQMRDALEKLHSEIEDESDEE